MEDEYPLLFCGDCGTEFVCYGLVCRLALCNKCYKRRCCFICKEEGGGFLLYNEETRTFHCNNCNTTREELKEIKKQRRNVRSKK